MPERYVLKEHQVYLVSDENGDISSRDADGQGLYWRDTRFLSVYELAVEGVRPTLLSAAGEHNFMNNLQFANEAFEADDGTPVAARTISIRRNRFIHGGLHERIGLFNYNPFPLKLRVTILVGSDFRDMFDVRGYTRRPMHGRIEPPVVEAGRVCLAYLGLDDVRRCTELCFDPRPRAVQLGNLEAANRVEARVLPGLSGHGDPRTDYRVIPPTAEVTFEVALPPRQPRSITVHAVTMIDDERSEQEARSHSLDQEFVLIRDSYRRWEAESTAIRTDHETLNEVIQQARRDLRLLSEQTAGGYLPSAGIPWFSVPFGRDSLITSLQTLMLQPELAYGSLRFLAARQGQRVDDFRDEQPGKILHEVRAGEVAKLGQVPHTPYYGSVDATPLFLVVLSELLRWTDDEGLMHELRPNVEAALEWLERYGDLDGDGYLEYATRSPHGIRNQGWKDSPDSIAYADGRRVEPPIALVEVQGYAYDARVRMAEYFRRLGDEQRARALDERAAELRARFLRDFRLPGEEYFGIALDPAKRLVPAVSSNVGHCLWSGLLDGELGVAVARRLLREDLNCGWGVRTLSSREPRFNPMSYHNGSVWPHDNAIIAAGMKRLGLDAEAADVVGDVLEAAIRFPHLRLPELYCGFTRDRRYHSLPAQYPVSCSPQAWAAGAVFMMLQTVLGLQVDAAAERLRLRPHLPRNVNRIDVRGLRIGRRRVGFEVLRERDRTRLEVSESGGLAIVLEPPGA